MRLGKELMGVAANGLKLNMTRLGPLVLPLSEQLLFAGNMIARLLLGPKKVKAYVPDFGLAFDHICLHTGDCGEGVGRDGLQCGDRLWQPAAEAQLSASRRGSALVLLC